MSQLSIGLDNPVYAGRLRVHGRRSEYERRPIRLTPRVLHDVMPVKPAPRSTLVLNGQKYSKAAVPVAKSVNHLSKKPARSAVLQRRLTSKPTPLTVQPSAKKKHTTTSKLLTAMAVMLFLGGVSISVWGWMTNRQVIQQVQAAGPGESSEGGNALGGELADLDETPPSSDAVRSYNVSPMNPRYIQIPKIGIKARIRSQGLLPDDTLKAPNNVHDAGWYEESSKPGEGGAVLIDGHVSGMTKSGIFANLKKLANGDEISVTRGDSQVFTYRVVMLETLSSGDVNMNKMLLSAEQGKQGLNIITCAGKYDPKTKTYDQRHIVYAVQK